MYLQIVGQTGNMAIVTEWGMNECEVSVIY
jgi:hypothetical protein